MAKGQKKSRWSASMTGALTPRPIRLTASDTMVTIANWTLILLHQIEINIIHSRRRIISRLLNVYSLGFVKEPLLKPTEEESGLWLERRIEVGSIIDLVTCLSCMVSESAADASSDVELPKKMLRFFGIILQ